jgi:hypothetical protein
MAAVAGLALGFAWFQLQHQSRMRDFQAFAEVQRDLDRIWERYVKGPEAERLFNFGQLVSFYETACYMFNHDILSRRVRELLKHQVIEVFVDIILDEKCMEMMTKICTGERSCEEIIKFVRKNKKQYERHWLYLQRMGLIGSK